MLFKVEMVKMVEGRGGISIKKFSHQICRNLYTWIKRCERCVITWVFDENIHLETCTGLERELDKKNIPMKCWNNWNQNLVKVGTRASNFSNEKNDLLRLVEIA